MPSSRGGAFGGKATKELQAKVAAKGEENTEEPTLGDDAKDPMMGDAHKLWNLYTSVKLEKASGEKDGDKGGDKKTALAGTKRIGKPTDAKMHITKSMLKDMVYELQRANRIRFVSLQKLEAFVDREWSVFVAKEGGSAKMKFNDFYGFYRKWLNVDTDAVLARLSKTVDEVERCFLEGDADGNMEIDKEELMGILRRRTPPGYPPPDEAALRQLVDDIFLEFDANGDGVLQYDEFELAFNKMIEMLDRLHQKVLDDLAQKAKGGGNSAFGNKLVNDDDLDDDDLEALEWAVSRRYEGETWVVSPTEILKGSAAAGMAQTAAGRASAASKYTVVEQAARVVKFPLLLKMPSEQFDTMAQRLTGRVDVRLVDVEKLMYDMGREVKPLSREDVSRAVRDELLECWLGGTPCALRLGQAAPDFAIDFNHPRILPYEYVFDPALQTPGPLDEALYGMLDGTGHDAAKFKIASGFQLIITSCFSMHTWRNNLRGKIPVHQLQPVQVCSSLSQIAFVLRDPRRACPEDDAESALAEMDRLAALLDEM